MKKTLSLLLTVCLCLPLLLSAVPAARAAVFPDVPAWAEDYVTRAWSEGAVQGFEDGTFRPSEKLTPAQFMTMLTRAVYPEDYAANSGGAWYEPAQKTAAAHGLDWNVEFSSFTRDELNRFQMAIILNNVLIDYRMVTDYEAKTASSDRRMEVQQQYLDGVAPITDVNYFMDEQKLEPLLNCYELGLLTGYEDGSFRGERSMTRAEAAAVYCRLSDLVSGLEVPAARPAAPVSVPAPEGALTVISLAAETAPTDLSGNTAFHYGDRYAQVARSYLYAEAEGGLCAVDLWGQEGKLVLRARHLDAGLNVLSTRLIPFGEYGAFGGFYSGEKYNYMAFGRENYDADDSVEVLTVLKLDKQFNVLGKAALAGIQARMVFRDTGCNMAEYGENKLLLACGRHLYGGHQDLLLVSLDTDTMQAREVTGQTVLLVSHCFEAVPVAEGEDLTLVTLCDANPARALLLHQLQASNSYQDAQADELLPIPGGKGDNSTGVVVGGVEASDRNYLTALSFRCYEREQLYTMGRYGSDVLLLVTSKDNTAATRTVFFTDLTREEKTTAGRPMLVKLSEDRFALLWEEYTYARDSLNNATPVVMKYALVDGSGNLIGQVRETDKALLSRNGRPVVWRDRIVWYTFPSVKAGDSVSSTFYVLDPTK